MKFILPILLVLVALAFPVGVLAAGLDITSIGGLSTEGRNFSVWTHQGANPRMVGTASNSAQVTVTINQMVSTVSASTVGEWTYLPTNLSTAGTYDVLVRSGSETKSFDLVISTASATPAATATPSTSSTTKGGVTELPQSGNFDTTLILVLGGLTLIGVGAYVRYALPLVLEEE